MCGTREPILGSCIWPNMFSVFCFVLRIGNSNLAIFKTYSCLWALVVLMWPLFWVLGIKSMLMACKENTQSTVLSLTLTLLFKQPLWPWGFGLNAQHPCHAVLFILLLIIPFSQTQAHNSHKLNADHLGSRKAWSRHSISSLIASIHAVSLKTPACFESQSHFIKVCTLLFLT